MSLTETSTTGPQPRNPDVAEMRGRTQRSCPWFFTRSALASCMHAYNEGVSALSHGIQDRHTIKGLFRLLHLRLCNQKSILTICNAHTLPHQHYASVANEKLEAVPFSCLVTKSRDPRFFARFINLAAELFLEGSRSWAHIASGYSISWKVRVIPISMVNDGLMPFHVQVYRSSLTQE